MECQRHAGILLMQQSQVLALRLACNVCNEVDAVEKVVTSMKLRFSWPGTVPWPYQTVQDMTTQLKFVECNAGADYQHPHAGQP